MVHRKLMRRCADMTERADVSDSSEPLPPGWQSAVDPSGRTYYYNMDTKVVRWERPIDCEKTKDVETSSTVVQNAEVTVDPVVREKMEKDFTVELTHAFVSKELRRSRHSSTLTLSPILQERIRSSLTRYMTSRGAVYKRRHKTNLIADPSGPDVVQT
ncbi:uncharacterized protein DEA37_0014168 [Paragonimus westermani]|uniref:WW domain-containing protein n=1 Tax=Paragonimus westermani TaxID=34504 RepID=A0A5J4NSR0_9TREM|nr:uncharacterized protein DEA37_0014168 [Paragonimus westermani]